MHSYLKTIGFHHIESKHQIDQILELAVSEPDYVNEVKIHEGEYLVEVRKYVGKGIGICVIGTRNANSDLLDIEHYFPFIQDEQVEEKEHVSFEKHTSGFSFAGICDDIRVGISLIFYVQNIMDFMKSKCKTGNKVYTCPVAYRAFSTSGNILLPIQKTQTEIQKSRLASQNRKKLIEDARKGDERAIEILTMEDLDTYNLVSRKVMKHDIFTIVDNSFMPCGIECDQYNIIGDIADVKKVKNDLTHEEMYLMKIVCNELNISLLIHKEDLMGQPKKGRRFKGSIWLQGYVKFVF